MKNLVLLLLFVLFINANAEAQRKYYRKSGTINSKTCKYLCDVESLKGKAILTNVKYKDIDEISFSSKKSDAPEGYYAIDDNVVYQIIKNALKTYSCEVFPYNHQEIFSPNFKKPGELLSVILYLDNDTREISAVKFIIQLSNITGDLPIEAYHWIEQEIVAKLKKESSDERSKNVTQVISYVYVKNIF